MSKGTERYWKRVDEWMEARRASGHTLTQAQESEHVEAVDDLWTALSEDEQAAVECEHERRRQAASSG